MKQTFAIGIGGAAGQGVATPGDIFAKIFSRRGLHLNAYNASAFRSAEIERHFEE
jgi:2-oxoglutarate ferredoxin oxidoreductase subunit alpha